MICPHCGTPNDIGVQFCKKCGSTLQNIKDYTDYAGATLRICAFSFDIVVITVPVLLVWIMTDLSSIMILGIVFVVSWVYTAVLESSSRQGTLGKMIMGIQVVDANRKRISFKTASLRHFAKVLTLIFQASYWYLVSFSEKKQAIHDMVANTYVVTKGAYPPVEEPYKPPYWYEAYKK